MQITMFIATLLLGTCLGVAALAADPQQGIARATFAVHCYDVGAGALDGRAGVISVERGWSGRREVDRVLYDPQIVSLEQLEDYLRQADTYLGTLESSRPARTGTGKSP